MLEVVRISHHQSSLPHSIGLSSGVLDGIKFLHFSDKSSIERSAQQICLLILLPIFLYNEDDTNAEIGCQD